MINGNGLNLKIQNFDISLYLLILSNICILSIFIQFIIMINFSIMLKNKHTIDSLIKGVLVHKTNCLFTNVTWHRNARNIKADRILKNYFNIRA